MLETDPDFNKLVLNRRCSISGNVARMFNVPLQLVYDPADPLAVELRLFPMDPSVRAVQPDLISWDQPAGNQTPVTWVFARNLISAALLSPMEAFGDGDVVTLASSDQETFTVFLCPIGQPTACVDIPTSAVETFDACSQYLVPFGKETAPDFDALLS